MSNTRCLTKHQKNVLLTVEKGNDDGSIVTMSQIIERINYQATRQAFQFVLKFMVGRGLIERVLNDNGSKTVGFKITDKGKSLAKNYKKSELKDMIVEADIDF